MSESDSITMEEWRRELESVGELGGDAGHTSAELAAHFGVPHRTMRQILAAGVADGRYIKGVGIRIDKTGHRQKPAVYRLAKARPR